jgi:hypothetical protein
MTSVRTVANHKVNGASFNVHVWAANLATTGRVVKQLHDHSRQLSCNVLRFGPEREGQDLGSIGETS